MKIILISLLLFPFFGIAQSNNSKKLTINGSVKGLPENSEVSLSDLNNPEDTISKAIVENGRFTLTGSLQEPNLYNLNFAGVAKKNVSFY